MPHFISRESKIVVSMERIIGHLDMDAFFAAVEERDEPRYAGRPIVVGADPRAGKGRGVVSTANYAARKYGIRSAMPISEAWRLAESARKKGEPEAVFVGGSFRKYGEVSNKIFSMLRSRVPHVEQASVDEGFMDLSFTGSYDAAEALAYDIKREIRARERLTASVGIGPNKLIAKIASDRQKPDGLTVIRPDDVETFLAPLSVRTIPGIGPKTALILARKGIRTIAELREVPLEVLMDKLGKWGSALYEKARGEDDAPVAERDEVKSIGEEETFERDTGDAPFLTERLAALSEEVHRRFLKSGFSGFRTVTVTVRFADFETKHRARTLSAPASTRDSLTFESLKLFLPFLDRRENPDRKKIRLVGVRIEKLG